MAQQGRNACAENAAQDTTWFHWFPTCAAMLAWFSHCLPIRYRQEAETIENDASVGLRVATFSEYVRRFEAGEMDKKAFLAALSSAYPDVTFSWIGTLRGLMRGKGAFARAWRSEFRMTGGSDDASPIRADEFDDFYCSLGSEA